MRHQKQCCSCTSKKELTVCVVHSGAYCPRKDGNKYSLCLCQKRLKVCVHGRMSVLFGEFISTHQHYLGQHDGQRRTGECWNPCVKVKVSASCLSYYYYLTHEIIPGSEEERNRPEDCFHAAVHQTGSPHHHCVSGTWLCLRQRHSGTHHLWFRWPWDDGDGQRHYLWTTGSYLGDFFLWLS